AWPSRSQPADRSRWGREPDNGASLRRRGGGCAGRRGRGLQREGVGRGEHARAEIRDWRGLSGIQRNYAGSNPDRRNRGIKTRIGGAAIASPNVDKTTVLLGGY